MRSAERRAVLSMIYNSLMSAGSQLHPALSRSALSRIGGDEIVEFVGDAADELADGPQATPFRNLGTLWFSEDDVLDEKQHRSRPPGRPSGTTEIR